MPSPFRAWRHLIGSSTVKINNKIAQSITGDNFIKLCRIFFVLAKIVCYLVLHLSRSIGQLEPWSPVPRHAAICGNEILGICQQAKNIKLKKIPTTQDQLNPFRPVQMPVGSWGGSQKHPPCASIIMEIFPLFSNEFDQNL